MEQVKETEKKEETTPVSTPEYDYELAKKEENDFYERNTPKADQTHYARFSSMYPAPKEFTTQQAQTERNAASIAESLKTLAEIYADAKGAHLQSRKAEESERAENNIFTKQNKYDTDLREYQRAMISMLGKDDEELKKIRKKAYRHGKSMADIDYKQKLIRYNYDLKRQDALDDAKKRQKKIEDLDRKEQHDVNMAQLRGAQQKELAAIRYSYDYQREQIRRQNKSPENFYVSYQGNWYKTDYNYTDADINSLVSAAVNDNDFYNEKKNWFETKNIVDFKQQQKSLSKEDKKQIAQMFLDWYAKKHGSIYMQPGKIQPSYESQASSTSSPQSDVKKNSTTVNKPETTKFNHAPY